MEINNVYHLNYYYNYGKIIIYHLYNLQVEVLRLQNGQSYWYHYLHPIKSPSTEVT